MTATLPPEVQQVFASFVTTEFTTVDAHGQPITSPLAPHYRPGDPCIDVASPTQADDARADSRVALLFSDATGSGLLHAPQVLVQGTAAVDDSDIHVRPERIYLWTDGDPSREPRLFDAHIEEVRSGHVEEPAAPHAGTEGGAVAWDERLTELGTRYRTAAISLVAPDGFPFSVRLPVELDRERRRVRLGGAPVGVPWQPGLACLTVHDPSPDSPGQRSIQVRGDLVEEDGAWALVPHRLAGGLAPPRGPLGWLRLGLAKLRRVRNAKRPGKPGR